MLSSRKWLQHAVGLLKKVQGISTEASTLTEKLQYIDGRRENPTGPENVQVHNPATGELLCDMKTSGPEDVNRAVAAAKDGFQIWSEMSGVDRSKVLHRAAQISKECSEELARVETMNNGKPLWEARFDIEGCIDTIEFYAGLAPTVQGKHLSLGGGSFGYTRREPLGVCGGIGAWNFPFQMATWKSAPALACGNAMVFKPSPLTPLTSVMLAQIYTEAGLPHGCFNVIQGSVDTGQYLSGHPDISKMSLTGSVSAGSKVMQTCAQGIKHISLELGGKSPLIIFDDADMENAVKGAMNANFYTQGQVCSNAARVYIHQNIYEEFADRVIARTRGILVGDPLKEGTQMGAVISKQQADTILDYIQGAKQQGATVACGGQKVTPEAHLSGGNFISPCVMVDVTDNMTIVKEEVFGPVMTLMTFDTEEEVLHRANNTELGLAGGIFTKDLQRAHRVAARLQAGSLYINNYNVYPPGLPFGGYKKSGLGRENGTDTMDYYTQEKAIYVEMNDVQCPY